MTLPSPNGNLIPLKRELVGQDLKQLSQWFFADCIGEIKNRVLLQEAAAYGKLEAYPT